MLLRRCLFAAAVCAAVALPSWAADKPTLADGKYLLTYSSSPASESRVAIVEVANKGGKYTAEVVATPPVPRQPAGQPARPATKVTVGAPTVANGLVTFPVELGPNKLTFEGKADPKDGKQLIGSLGDAASVMRAVFAPTEKTEFQAGEHISAVKVPDDLAQANKLRNEPLRLQTQMRTERDADKRQELMDKAKEAQKEADEKVPALLRKVVDDGANTAAGFYATLDVLATAGRSKAKPEDVTKWADAALTYAATHGPRFERYALGRIATTLANQRDLGEVGIKYVEKLVAAVEKVSAGEFQKALKLLATAQKSAGKDDLAKATEEKAAGLEPAVDAEYKKTVPPFAPEKYAGRKEKGANRVAVMELFTGAQCPPCVAADVAFDALEHAYSPKDLVLIQYHMHIPGPDPLTNPDTVARWDYYSKLFNTAEKRVIGGTPTTLFNGKVAAGGGGGMGNAKNKFDQYKEQIDPILEQKSDLTVGGTAALVDGTVKVDATIGGMDKADGLKVRVLLLEEEIKYVGSNGLRFHHMVVRSAFGKADGWDAKDGKVAASVALDDVKKGLTAYLDEYAKTRPFPYPHRPMDLKGLKVIVLVQNDETGEILQAAQMDVTGGKS